MDDADKNTGSSKSEDHEWTSTPAWESGMGAMFAPLTADYLLERGYCCGNGCKNCPYDYKAVPEPRRSKLLEQRKNNSNK
jgi:hypothetical protein